MRVFVGPAPEGITGQSIAFAAAAKLARPGDAVIYNGCWGDRGPHKITRFLGAWARLIGIVATRRVTTVYITTSRTPAGFVRDALLILTARTFRRPRIVNHLHGSDFAAFRDEAPILLKWAIDFVYSQISCSVVPHDCMVDQYAAYPSMDLTAVPNFVPAELMASRPARPPDRKSTKVNVLFLSNLIAEKGIVETIAAVDMLALDGFPILLSIAGFGEEDALIALTKKAFGAGYEPGEHIQLLGPLYAEDKIDAYNSADIFVLPSYYPSEAFPLAALEAMAFGCALVLSDFKYLPRIFGAAGARFVTPRSAKGLQEALLPLCVEPELRLALGHQNWRAAAVFTEDVYRARLAEIIDSPA